MPEEQITADTVILLRPQQNWDVMRCHCSGRFFDFDFLLLLNQATQSLSFTSHVMSDISICTVCGFSQQTRAAFMSVVKLLKQMTQYSSFFCAFHSKEYNITHTLPWFSLATLLLVLLRALVVTFMETWELKTTNLTSHQGSAVPTSTENTPAAPARLWYEILVP